jgi:PAS domain S-box-containing protein
MAELLVQFPTITGIGAVAPDGVQFCSGLSDSTGISLDDRPYFQQALHNKSLAISGYIIGRQTGRPHLNFAYPALDATGEVRAVVVLAFSLGRVSANLSATPLPNGGTISLVDGDGVLLARAPPASDWIGRQVSEAAFAKSMLTQRQGVMEAVGIDGTPRLHGFAPLLASADLFAVVGLPWREAYATADREFWRETTWTLLAFVLAAIAARIGGEVWILRPVAGLQRVVRGMEGGDLTARARTDRGSPELRRLAASFNEMTSALRKRRADLEGSEARFRAVVETAADGIITFNAQGIIEAVNPEAERLFGYRPDEMIGQRFDTLMPHPPSRPPPGEATIISIGREVTGRRKDGTVFPVSLSTGEFELDRERFFTGIVRDITERKRAEERQRLLTAEIDHRAKNLLASVQAMVLLTKRDAGSVGDFAESLIGRLQSLARAHDLLARDKWTGARLHAVIGSELQAYAGADGDRLTITGDDVRLAPRAAQTLSLALHELTTNAAKYGALSVPAGRVTVDTAVEGQELLLSWVETGGPEVTPPEERGFGSIVIERSIAHELGGSAKLDFERGGLRCHVRVPLN